MAIPKFGVGQAVRRKEDDRLIRGTGRYVADVAADRELHAVVVRSPHAHATFTIENADDVRAMPGVRLVLTSAETAQLGTFPCKALLTPDMKVPDYPMLATGTARYVGDAVAFVVADTLAAARDAAEALSIDWQALPHVIGAGNAVAAGAPKVWDAHDSNVVYDVAIGDADAAKAAFSAASKVVELTVVNQRLVSNYMDTRGVVAEYDGERYTLTLGSQGSHVIRDVLCENILKIPPDKMRVVTPDVGGGFGTKMFPYREYALAAFAAEKLRKPVKWIGDRSEHFLSDYHGRDNLTTARLALDDKGKMLGLEIDIIGDMGAYLSFYAPYIPYLGGGMATGVYDIPACHVRVRGVFTNTVPVDAYRGAGRPEAAYLIERLVDVAAHDLGIAPDTLRKRNFVKPGAMPYTTPTGKIYDSGNFAAHLARAQQMIGWDGFKAREKQARKQGKIRGIGMSTYVEACGNVGPERAQLTLDKDGGVTLLIGSQSTGQGHETAYAQIVAQHLGLPPDKVRTHQGDTDRVATGLGTGGSSSIPCGGASLDGAARKLADKIKTFAADALEASEGDLEIDGGAVRIVGTDRSVSFADIAAKQGAVAADDTWKVKQPTFPNGTHIVEVELDPGTGHVDLINYVVVDDFGVTLNPLLLAGQVHGGSVQGIGQALLENTVYDVESGQLVSASLMDYALPRAASAPSFQFETLNVPCKTNPLGVKGAGEAGAIGSCPAVMNAIVDALWRNFGIRHIDMPASPEKIWSAIVRSGKATAA